MIRFIFLNVNCELILVLNKLQLICMFLLNVYFYLIIYFLQFVVCILSARLIDAVWEVHPSVTVTDLVHRCVCKHSQWQWARWFLKRCMVLVNINLQFLVLASFTENILDSKIKKICAYFIWRKEFRGKCKGICWLG